MVDMAFEHHNYDDMSVEHLASIRDYGIERVNTVTEVLKTQVRKAHDDGEEIKRLAIKANVTRPTIYSWLAK